MNQQSILILLTLIFNIAILIIRLESGLAALDLILLLIILGINMFTILKKQQLEQKLNYYKKKANLMYDKAIRDGMTGIYNCQYVISRLKDKNEPYSIVMLDIDDFKEINDEYGHQVGDRVIKYVANQIKATVRKNDLVGRYGGDEFISALFNCQRQEAYVVAKKIKNNIGTCCKLSSGETIPVTISVGVYTGNVNETIEDILHQADMALYQAKNRGKNRVIGC